jgi:hypothetical protein
MAASQRSISARATSQRVRKHAWCLAAQAYQRYVDELQRRLSTGTLRAEHIEAWRPLEFGGPK